MAIDSQASESNPTWRVDSGYSRFSSPSMIPAPKWYQSGKQAMDFMLALVFCLFAAPVIVAAGLLVKLTSRGPIFYSQARLGRFGKPFTIYKIRTMRHQCETVSGPQWSTPGDVRITLIGRMLRKTHIDELPQLWNVLRGEMSLVGPRPERPEFIPQLEKHIPCYGQRLLVNPGITGLAQVQLPPDTDLNSVRRKLAYDIYYLNRNSLWLDFRLIVCTGLVFLAIPYTFSRWLLRVPGGPFVEEAYMEVVTRSTITAEIQPA